MPNVTSGFSGTEIVDRVARFVGNFTSSFQTYVQNTLPLAEFRFCKMHDWSFLRKVNLPLTISNGNNEYTLELATIGYYMAAEDVETIYDTVNGNVLRRVELNQLRGLDPENDDGSSDDSPTLWAPAGDNKIVLWPPTFASGTLRVDGKITPVAMTNLADFPTVPYRYQEALIEYIIAMALERENDERAPAKKQEAIALIQQDIKDDLRQLAQVENPRIRSLREAERGVGGNKGYLWAWFNTDD